MWSTLVLAHLATPPGPGRWVMWLGVAACGLGALRLAGVGRQVPERVGGITLVAGVGLVVLAGFAPAGKPPAASSRPSTPGSVRIVEPASGTEAGRARVRVVFDVRDFELVSETGSAPRPGIGHLHVAIDGKVVDMPYTARDVEVCVPEGRHEISATLIAEDHFGFSNEAQVRDTVEVTGAAGTEC